MSKKDTVFVRNPGMIFPLSFVTVAAVNMVVIGLANMFFPENIVLGTMSITPLWANMLVSSAISLLTVLALPFVHEVGFMKNRDLTPAEMLGLYYIVNVLGLWLLTRASDIFGLGVSSWIIVLILAAILNFAQGLVMMGVEKMRNS